MLHVKYSQFLVGVAFISGIVFGLSINHINQKSQADILNDFKPVREKEAGYDFINPILLYKVPNGGVLPEYQALNGKIKNEAEDFKRDAKATDVSVYYRDLNDERWVGYNESQKYTPASLLKVVVMIQYFKESESNPQIFSHRIMYTKSIQNLLDTLPYDRGTELVLGESYSVDDLIHQMITRSDNGAAYALLSEVSDSELAVLFNDLGLGNPTDMGRDYTISARGYSFFFRILYDATYLNKDTSEKALELLASTDFKQGLVSGLPSSLQVSHKYGESVIANDAGSVTSVELHDCGIVYNPDHPYFLCVMTQGHSLDDLKGVIGSISKTVYDSVVQRN